MTPSDKTPIFTPVPSTEGFILADKFVNLIMGPVGSTKTTASLIKIIHEAKRKGIMGHVLKSKNYSETN